MSKPSFHEWLFVTVDWRISSGAMKGRRYTFDAFPCIEPIIRDDSNEQSVMKSAQMALSEQYTLQRPFYHMDVHGRNWGIMFPKQGAMRDFYRTRVKNSIAANPYIRRNTSKENESNVDAFNRSLYLRYTTTEGAIATFDADGITIDEQDIHNPDTLYGAKTSRRQGAMGQTFWYEISTPTYPNYGIHLSYLNSDQHVWLIKCGGCGHENDLTQNFGPYDTRDIDKFFRDHLEDVEDYRDYFIPCSKCGKAIDPVNPLDTSKKSLGGGRWVPRYPTRSVRGYHIQIFQRLYKGGTPMVLRRVRDNLLAAHKPKHVRRWWNSTIGMPFIPSEGRLTEDDILLATTTQAGPWNQRTFRNVYGLRDARVDWMGVDVRDEQYHIFGMKRDGKTKKTVSLLGWVETSGELRMLWEYVGRPMFMIDAQPDTNESRRLVEGMGRRARRGKFAKRLNATWSIGADDDLVMINRPAAMEAVKSAVVDGSWVFPAEAWDVGAGIEKVRGTQTVEETVRDHFKAPTMVKDEDDYTGEITYDFPKEAMEGVDPHYYMAASLAWVAAEMKGAPAIAVSVPR